MEQGLLPALVELVALELRQALLEPQPHAQEAGAGALHLTALLERVAVVAAAQALSAAQYLLPEQ